MKNSLFMLTSLVILYLRISAAFVARIQNNREYASLLLSRTIDDDTHLSSHTALCDNSTSLIVSRPLSDITTSKLHSLYTSEFKTLTYPSNLIEIQGYIVKHRSYGPSLAFIDLIESDCRNETAEILLKRDSYGLPHQQQNRLIGPSPLIAIMKSLKPGMKIQCIGLPSSTKNPGEVVFLAHNVRILRPTRDPQAIKGILQRVNWDNQQPCDTMLNLDEIASCLQINCNTLRTFLAGDGQSSSDNVNTNTRVWNRSRIAYTTLAAEILKNLETDDKYPERFLQALHTKKSKRGSLQVLDTDDVLRQIQSHHYENTLPAAPDDYVKTARNILSQRKHHVESMNGSIDPTVATLSVEAMLENIANNHNHDYDTQLVSTSGWVLNRKQYKDSITVLWIADDSLEGTTNIVEEEESTSNRIKLILDRRIMDTSTQNVSPLGLSPFDVYGYMASPGARLSVNGYITYDIKKSPTLWVTQIRLERCSWRPNNINFLLTFLSLRPFNEDTLDEAISPLTLEEITTAFDLAGGEAEAVGLIQFCTQADATARQWRAAEISTRLQEQNLRTKQLSSEMSQVLDDFELARNSWPLEHVPLTNNRVVMPENTRTSSAGSRWERAKRPQLEWMAREIVHVVQNHPEFGNRPLSIIDIGGGRGHLANYVSSVLGDSAAVVTVIDIDSRAVKNGMMRSKRGMLPVNYAVGDASDTTFLTEMLGHVGCVDVVVALHACGALSDVAISFASMHSASFVIVPCCFRSNSHLLVSVKKGDLYEKVVAAEWLGIQSEELRVLNLVAEIQGDSLKASKGVHTLCALRANAAKSYQRKLSISLKTFPISFSTRNFCIIGIQQGALNC